MSQKRPFRQKMLKKEPIPFKTGRSPNTTFQNRNVYLFLHTIRFLCLVFYSKVFISHPSKDLSSRTRQLICSHSSLSSFPEHSYRVQPATHRIALFSSFEKKPFLTESLRFAFECDNPQYYYYFIIITGCYLWLTYKDRLHFL